MSPTRQRIETLALDLNERADKLLAKGNVVASMRLRLIAEGVALAAECVQLDEKEEVTSGLASV